MREEILEGTVAIRGNCGHCDAKDVLFQVIKSFGMILIVECPVCKTLYTVDLIRIMNINQLGG